MWSLRLALNSTVAPKIHQGRETPYASLSHVYRLDVSPVYTLTLNIQKTPLHNIVVLPISVHIIQAISLFCFTTKNISIQTLPHNVWQHELQRGALRYVTRLRDRLYGSGNLLCTTNAPTYTGTDGHIVSLAETKVSDIKCG